MTTDELFRNVVRGHKTVIALCILLPMIAMAMVLNSQARQWDASVRLQVASEAPTSATQAEGLSSRVFAIATAPALLTKAMQDAKVTGSVEKQAKKISVERLGESPVVRLSVTGPDAKRIARLAAALAGRVATFMNHGDRGPFDAVLLGVDARIADAQAKQAKLLLRLGRTVDLNARSNINAEIGQVQSSLSQLNGERSALLVSDTNRDQVTLIGSSKPDLTQVPSTLLPRLALAGIFGVVLGLSMAAALELLRPRLRGPRAVARALKVPLIVPASPQPAVVAASLAMAARRRGVETVVLIPADARSRQRVPRLQSSIRKLAPGGRQRPVAVRQRVPGPVDRSYSEYGSLESDSGRDEVSQATRNGGRVESVKFAGIGDLRPDDELGAGIVVVNSGVMRRRDLDRIDDLVNLARWPVLGVLDGTDLPNGGTL